MLHHPSSALKPCPELNNDSRNSRDSGSNFTTSFNTENFHRSERIRIQLTANDRVISATALLSELRRSDLITPSAFSVWLVNGSQNDDSPIDCLTRGEESLFAKLRAVIQDDRLLRPLNLSRQLLGSITHPDNLSPGEIILAEAVDCSTDAYARAAHILGTFACYKTPDLSPPKPSNHASLRAPYRAYDVSTRPTHELIAKLIDAQPSARSVLLELHEVLARVDQSQPFTVANAVMTYLRRNDLQSLQGLVAKLIQELWRSQTRPELRTA